MGMGGLAYEQNDGEMMRIGNDNEMIEEEKIRTPDNRESILKGAEYEEVVFDVESNYSGRRVSPAAGRQGPLHSIAKANTNAVRKIGACWRCKFLRKPCSTETLCDTCSTGNGKSFWDVVGCKRGDLKGNMAPISLCPARNRAMSSSHLASPDPNGPGFPVDWGGLNHVWRWHIGRRDFDIRGFNFARELSFGLTISLYSSLCASNFLQPTLAPLNECILAIAWEFNEDPSGLFFDVLQHVGHSSLETFVISLRSAAVYQAKLESNQLIAQSLICLRTCLEALKFPVTESDHYYCSFNSCQVQWISNVELHTELYLDELSSVFFGNANLFQGRHWISIFYSFFIQATVRKLLQKLSSGTGILHRHSASTASSEEYLHLAVNLFVAASRAYDPLTTDNSTPLQGDSNLNDIALLKQALGSESQSSVECLRKLFEIENFQDQKPSSHKLHATEHVDPFSRGEYHALSSSTTQPRYLNNKESISEDFSLTDAWRMREHSPRMGYGASTMKEQSTNYEQTINDEMARQKANDEQNPRENLISWPKNPVPVPREIAPFRIPPGWTVSSPKNTQSEALLKGSISTTRSTAGNRMLKYTAKIIQQPERARACDSGAKASSNRRPVDPAPIVELRILELKDGLHTDVTFSYDASFFMYATLENSQPIAPNRGLPNPPSAAKPVLTGMPVSGAAYLDRPREAIYFIFPNLLIRHPGKYTICFTLFEETKHLEDQDETATEPGLFSNAVTPTNSDAGRESFHNRLEIKSNQFTVFSAKNFPGIAESTRVSKTLAEQGCRVRIRRDVRMKRMEGRDYDSEDDVDGSLYPIQPSSPQLGVQDERFRHKSTGSSKQEEVAFWGGRENLNVRQLPQLQAIASYKPGPAPTPPPMPVAMIWSPRENPRSLDISKEILKNHSANLDPTVVYPAVIEKENTQLPEVSGQSVSEVSRALSHSEAASARNKNVSANKSVEKERRKMFDDATSKESVNELSLPVMDHEPLVQEHDQGYRQTTQETLIQLQQKNHLKWESIKDSVKTLYMTKGKSLREMMFEIETQYDFRASERQLKMKLKQWGFTKHLSATNMQFIVAKSTKRHREEGKETIFFHKGSHITANRIEAFKKRRWIEDSGLGSSSASTPESVTYCTPPSDTDSTTHSDKTIAHDVNHDDVCFLASGSPAAVSREEIWSALRRCLGSRTDASSLEYSTNEAKITPVNGEPLSHKIKRSCQEWWLANASEPWERILPDENLIVFPDRQLLHLIFSSWHRDWISGSSDLRDSWCWLWSTDEASEQEDRIIEKLVHDISVQLGRTTAGNVNGHVKTTPGGSSSSNGPSGSTSRINSKSCETSKSIEKRRARSEAERDDDSLDEDDPNQNDSAKRRKRSPDDLNRYVICTQYAAGQESARNLTKCFFGAWCSVDRLKQDHLIKVHNFETSQMQIDRGGTESEKWWRLFDKLNPGFRDTNPEKFIPGPFYEDRVAHNTYNKIFSEAMKRTERIQQRRAQSLASDIQSLLNRHQNGERQEIRQVVLDVLHSRESVTISSEQLSISERTRSESNSFHNESDTMFTPILQQPESLISSNLTNNNIMSGPHFNAPGNANSFTVPSLPERLSDVPDSDSSSSWQRPQMNTSIVAQSSNSSGALDTSHMLGVQYGVDPALNTIASSETTLGRLNSGFGLPNGKLCRCRLHNTECDRMVGSGYEFCTCCSGWFSWSAFLPS